MSSDPLVAFNRIGVLTGGGDCPGLNAVIRAVVRQQLRGYGGSVFGFHDGWRCRFGRRLTRIRSGGLGHWRIGVEPWLHLSILLLLSMSLQLHQQEASVQLLPGHFKKGSRRD